ncbi:MAG: PilT protein domain protein [Verrucomicrobiales bacterium]|nr:PilT protein domain protein [Verrucomicrobiales bacterium]
MNVCFDTSTLVAALLEKHPHHSMAFPHLLAAQKRRIQAYLTTHALAELFATLTALPLKPRLLPQDVQRLVESSILPHFEVIPLSPADYRTAMTLTASGHFISGAIYDALHIIGARNARCKKLLTLNMKHFKALAPGDAMIVSP